MHSSRSLDQKITRKEKVKRDDRVRRERRVARDAKRNWEVM